jgi:hypothetical protein
MAQRDDALAALELLEFMLCLSRTSLLNNTKGPAHACEGSARYGAE